MSAKRAASSELNHENWDQDDPADHEQMGTFKTAPKEMLEKRVIRTAKRRSQVSTDESKKSLFSGFGGFNKPPPSSFDFLANLTNGSKPTNGAGTKSETAVTSSLFTSKPSTTPSGGLFGIPAQTSKPGFGSTQTTSLFMPTATKSEIPSMTFSSSKADSTVGDSPFKIQPVSSSADSNAKPSIAQVSSTIFGVSSTSPNQNKSSSRTMDMEFKQPVSSTSTTLQNTAAVATQSNSSKNEATIDKEAEIEKARNKYYSRLKGLNESVSSWIVKHVEKTPLCFLSPIFKDYENYLKEIQEEYEAAKVEIEAKIKHQTSEVKPVFGTKDSGASLLQNKSAGFTNDTKANQIFSTNATAASTTSNTGLFGQPSTSISKSPTKPTTPSKDNSFGVKSAPSATTLNSPPSTAESTGNSSQGFSFGMKPADKANTDTPVSPPIKGFSFGIFSSTTQSTSAFAANPVSASSPPSKGFSFGVTMSTAAASPTNASPFASTSAVSTGSPVQGFSFGMTSTAPTTSPTNSATSGAAPFSFGIGSGTPFSFSSKPQQSTEIQKEDEEDQPPKVEYTPVVEENSVFDKKCKIFVKKEGNFIDKGVGTLYVKKIEESGKHQLLVRANTNLGTVLLNLILSSGVPTQRIGKNNVMLVCIPTPDAKPPPSPVLIRVKTGEEADELLEILKKYES